MHKFSYLFICCSLLLVVFAEQNTRKVIMTVQGPVSAKQVGITLSHEHLLVDFIGADSTGYSRWDRKKVLEKVLPYLEQIKDFGVKTFVDCTPAFLGRDPWLLRELSEKSGIHILTPTGYYGAYANKFVPQYAFEMSAEELAELWIAEFESGIEGTDVRPGIIKIAVERGDSLSGMHKKIVKAAAITHLATGLTIVSHTGPEPPAYEQIALLEAMGVAPEAFVWTHAHEGTMEAHIELAQKGVWISLDKMNNKQETVDLMVDLLRNLKLHNLLDKVLISHDAGWYKPGEPDGGFFRGFTSIFSHLLPALRENGFNDADIDLILVKNPQKAFSIDIRKVES